MGGCLWKWNKAEACLQAMCCKTLSRADTVARTLDVDCGEIQQWRAATTHPTLSLQAPVITEF